MTKYVYLFTEGNADMRNLLGGKGANLAEMTNLGLPVPQGFTITTEACTKYYEDGKEISPEIQDQINEYIGKMEEITGKKFGDKENPLLVSVRSGARASMPGMMDTILNLGLNEDVVEVLAEKSNNPRWAWDCYRRFIQMYSDVVMEVGKKYFEELIDKMKEEKGVKLDVELDADDLKELAREFKEEYKNKNRGIELIKVDDSYQLCTKKELYEYVYPVLDKRTKPNLSNAALETLAIIAYNPKITRAEIEAIRGVSADACVYKLLEYGLIEEAGKIDLPGKPMSYRTTNDFLKMFGYSSLEELPELPKYKLDENKQIVIDDIIEENEKEAQEPEREDVNNNEQKNNED